MDLSVIKDEIKQIVKVSQYIGSNRRTDCPEPLCDGKGRKADCQPYEDSWYCFMCKSRGDIFSWVMLTQSCNFGTALRTLADHAGVALEPHPERTMLLERFLQSSQQYLRENPSKLEYLVGRGLDLKTLEKHEVGYCDVLGDVLDSSGLTAEQMLGLGLSYPSTFGITNHLGGRFIFPVRDVNGNLISLKGRANPGDLPNLDSRRKSLPLKAEGPWGRHSHMDCLYLEEQLRSYSDYVFICEGEPDTLTLRSWGINAVGVMTNTGIAKHAHKLKKFKRIYFVLDNDVNSQKQIVNELYNLQVKLPNSTIINVTLPDLAGEGNKVDVNDYKAKYSKTKKDFGELALKSPEAVNIILDEWAPFFKEDRTYSSKIYSLIRSIPDRRESMLAYLSNITGIPTDMLGFAADTSA
jgi:DNA primase